MYNIYLSTHEDLGVHDRHDTLKGGLEHLSFNGAQQASGKEWV